MDKAARDELWERLQRRLTNFDHSSFAISLDELRTLFTDYDALKEKHRLCGTKIAAQKGIVQGLRTKIADYDALEQESRSKMSDDTWPLIRLSPETYEQLKTVMEDLAYKEFTSVVEFLLRHSEDS